MNKVILVGNLTRDPELNNTNSGIPVCRMGIAINRIFGGEKEVDFFNIVAWRGLAENCNKYLKKGSKIAVCGRLQINSYEDKDGIKRSSPEIVAEDIEFLSSRSETEGFTATQNTAAPKKTDSKKQKFDQLEPVEDDDLPF